MKAKDLRQLSEKELLLRLKEKKSELSSLRFDVKIGQESDYSSIEKLRKEIARISTVIAEGVFSEKKVENIKETAKKDSKSVVKSDKITKSQED